MAEILVIYDESIPTEQGQRYFARAVGMQRGDTLWEGSLEFVSTSPDASVLRSGRETTQPNRSDLEYWAQGLTRVYLEGALNRAVAAAGSRDENAPSADPNAPA